MSDRINAIARQSQPTSVPISVSGLTMAYGDFVLMRDLNFEVKRGDIFFIMGGSGCGKSTLLYHLIGLKEPVSGEIFYDGRSFTTGSRYFASAR
jgi:phospholipid/cholesterol/gamma-HCH transport system ATP-binding protein